MKQDTKDMEKTPRTRRRTPWTWRRTPGTWTRTPRTWRRTSRTYTTELPKFRKNVCVWVFLVRNYVRFVQYSLWVDECKCKAQAKWYFAGGEVWLNDGWLNRSTLKGCLPLHLFVFIFRNTWTPMTWSPWTWLILTQNMASSIRSSAIRGQGLRPRVSITCMQYCTFKQYSTLFLESEYCLSHWGSSLPWQFYEPYFYFYLTS